MGDSESSDYENEEYGLGIAIKLMKRSLAEQIAGLGNMKATARTLIAASSIIVSLLATFQILSAAPIPMYLSIYNWMLIAVAVLYVLQMSLCILIISPTRFVGPIKEDWDLLYQTFIDKKKIEILGQYLTVYLTAIEDNKPILYRIKLLTNLAGILLIIVVVLILLLSTIPRIGVPH